MRKQKESYRDGTVAQEREGSRGRDGAVEVGEGEAGEVQGGSDAGREGEDEDGLEECKKRHRDGTEPQRREVPREVGMQGEKRKTK